jgi:lipoprotein-anchoring transpeptidase ErfK/SrfK
MVNNWRLLLTAGGTSRLRALREQTGVGPESRADFSRKSTPIHLLYRRSKNREPVMRRHAVILAAALAWLISSESAEARLDILVDKATQRMLVIQNGYMRYIWPVSTGRDQMATPSGVYAPQRLERNWFSNAYYNSPMPYSIFFHNGYAIHGSEAIDRLGGPASHGCVRLHPHHAARLFDLVQQEGPDKTTIEVTDEARPYDPSLPRREIEAGGRGAYPPVPPVPPAPRIVRYRETGDMPELPSLQRGNPPLPGGEIEAGGRGAYPPVPPVPRIVRYRETGDMPELPPLQRGNRPIAARNSLPPRPPVLAPPPAGRRMATDVRPPANAPPANAPPANAPPANTPPANAPPANAPSANAPPANAPPANAQPANAPRAPCGAGEADTANGSPDCRPKLKVAGGPSPQPAQPAPSISGFKLLPSSCWSGGASRWRWWASGHGNPCK